ncbi:hypothetical protein DL98DRAFT_535496 [Cadophora sp. DSE1049]|nr:hypothetical protein DL98DRAFT_535496 [Cadophora sp. DSE1049]
MSVEYGRDKVNMDSAPRLTTTFDACPACRTDPDHCFICLPLLASVGLFFSLELQLEVEVEVEVEVVVELKLEDRATQPRFAPLRQSREMATNEGFQRLTIRRGAQFHQRRPHGTALSNSNSASDLDEVGESVGTPGQWRESGRGTSDDDGPSSETVLPCGARMGDPAIWTPLPQDPEELPVIVARSMRSIPQQVIVCNKLEYLSAKPPNAEPENRHPPKPLTEFPLFLRLPIELRINVYKYASLVPRIIAIEFRHDPQDPAVLDANPKTLEKIHRKARACPRSRVPSLMHVYQESRQECIQIYTKAILSRSGAMRGDYIYVNHCVDMLHFGGNNICASAIRSMLSNTGGHILPRLSVDISGSEALCCTDASLPFRNSRPVELLASLHGYWHTTDGQMGPTYHHFNGLEDLSFVVGSKITHLQPDMVDCKSSFRPAVTNGVSDREMILKSDLDFVISWVKRRGPISLTQQFWKAETLPSIKSVSFAPAIEYGDCRVMEIMTAQAAAVYWLDFQRKSLLDFGLINKLERQYHCEIIIPRVTPCYREKGEVGIKGAKEDVKKFRESLKAILVDLQRTSLEIWCSNHPLMVDLIFVFCLLVPIALFVTLLWHLGLLQIFGRRLSWRSKIVFCLS